MTATLTVNITAVSITVPREPNALTYEKIESHLINVPEISNRKRAVENIRQDSNAIRTKEKSKSPSAIDRDARLSVSAMCDIKNPCVRVQTDTWIFNVYRVRIVV